MSSYPLSTLVVATRRPLIWLLIVAVMVYGVSAALVQMLGPAHRHDQRAPVASAGFRVAVDAMFRDIRAWRGELQARLLPDGMPGRRAVGPAGSTTQVDPVAGQAAKARHSHAHTDIERHRHDPADTTVVTLDAASESAVADVAASQAAAGSASLPLGMAPRLVIARAPATAVCWVASGSHCWSDAPVSRAERPPRA